MTREESIKLDKRVIEALKFEVNSVDGMGYWVYVGDDQDACLFRPSENVRDAWHVVEKMYEKEYAMQLMHVVDGRYFTAFSGDIYREYLADTAPEAICRAALLILAVLEATT